MTNKIKYLKDATNLQELKKLYFELSKKYHPDMQDGNLEIMKMINNEFDYLKKVLKNATNTDSDNTTKTKKQSYENAESMEAFRSIIEELMKYKRITIEIVGSWLWISGRGTFGIKDSVLYNMFNFRYSKGQKKFYWFNGIENSNKCKGGYLKKAIDRYGITKIQSKGQMAIA